MTLYILTLHKASQVDSWAESLLSARISTSVTFRLPDGRVVLALRPE